MDKTEFKFGQGELNGIYDAADNLKDIYEQLVAIHDITMSERDSVRELFANKRIVRSALGDTIDALKNELPGILRGVDAIRRQTMDPEEYERNKTRQAIDDRPYMLQDDVPREIQDNT